MANNLQFPDPQFRPLMPSQQFIPATPHFPSLINNGNGMPSQIQQPQFPHMMQQLPLRPVQLSHAQLPTQTPSLPPAPPLSMQVASGSPLPMPNIQAPNNYMSAFGAPLLPSYTFVQPSFGQIPVAFNAVTHYPPISHIHAPAIPTGLPLVTESATPVEQSGQHSIVSAATVTTTNIQCLPAEQTHSDWIEHTSANGKRYYYNKRTKQSNWDKPVELMTPIEGGYASGSYLRAPPTVLDRADASTDWKEFTSPNGRKYYYNKVTKQSKWELPEELKLARERVGMISIKEMPHVTSVNSPASNSVASLDKAPSTSDGSVSAAQRKTSSPAVVASIGPSRGMKSLMVSEDSVLPADASPVVCQADVQETVSVTPSADRPGIDEKAVRTDDTSTPQLTSEFSTHDAASFVDCFPAEGKEEAGKGVVASEKAASEEKVVDSEPVGYADKMASKDAFKALLMSTNIGSDWTWEQAMRVIINDKRYGALRTLGERKQAFNEFLGQKKKQEVEERRTKQKKAKEEFKKMLEESMELSSSTRLSKVVTIFEDDKRFKAVERERDRKDLIENYLEDLGKKEKEKSQEERKSNIMEYRKFLESCDFIKVGTQWRKVQERLEADDRCSRLEKIDRLEIFQDYIQDLGKEEEEQKRKEKDELRKTERKKREEFRKLMDEHVSAGTLKAKTHWRDYYLEVKDLPAYLDVASNTSGLTPKDLFEDVVEELEKKYKDDKTRIKDAVKSKKVAFTSSWTLDDFKALIAEDIGSPPTSEINIKMVFAEMVERMKEKEEKEAKKRKLLADEFRNLLCSSKEVTASSKWEKCKGIFEGCREYSSIGEENFCREVFDKYITELQEQEKENDRKRKEKAKKEKDREERDRKKSRHRRERDREHDREKEEQQTRKDAGGEIEIAVTTEGYEYNEKQRLAGEDSKKQRKRHDNTVDDSFNDAEKNRSKSSHHKSRRPESDGESSKHKRHKREHRNGSRRNENKEDIEDGEFGH